MLITYKSRAPSGGKMSQHLNNLKIGDGILAKGPKGHLDYRGRGAFTIKKKDEVVLHKVKKIGMIAGGKISFDSIYI